MGGPARYNATLDLVPYAKSQCGGWNATAHARRSFHSVAGPMGRERAKRNGILPTGTFVDGRWGCDKHTCAAFCHDDCAPCEVRQSVQRWCGKEVKQVWCGVGEPADCLVEGHVCARFFDCGIHKCEKPRHPSPSPQPSECPPSPSHVTHCPCGKSTTAPSSSVGRSQRTFAAAQIPSPLAPPLGRIPTRCSHPCQAKSHTGPRPPCSIEITTTRSLPCYQVRNSGPSNHPAEEARSSAIAHARFSAPVVDINVVGCVVPLRL